MTTLAPIHTEKLDADQYLMLGEDPPGVRLELIDGEIIVSPSVNRTHAEIVLALAYILESHNRKYKLGKLYLDTDVLFTNRTVRRPDIAFYTHPKLVLMTANRLTLPPDLCIEVLSPGNVDDDRINKFDLYQSQRVPHYWILDPQSKIAECFTLQDKIYIRTHIAKSTDTLPFPPFTDLAIPFLEIWNSGV